MRTQPDPEELAKKTVRLTSMMTGGIYAGFGILAWFMVLLQKGLMPYMLDDPDVDESFIQSMSMLHRTWGTYMPLLILLGLIYIGFGLLLNTMQHHGFKVFVVITILTLGWLAGYLVRTLQYPGLFMSTDQGFSDPVALVFAGIGTLFMLAFFTVPQFVIARKLRKMR